MLLSAECAADSTTDVKGAAASGDKLVVPEDVGAHAARCLLEEARRGGVVDGTHQGLLLLLCALGPEEVSKVRLGPLTPHAVRTLRHLKSFFGVQFSIKPEASSNTVFLSCVGAGIRNVARKVR